MRLSWCKPGCKPGRSCCIWYQEVQILSESDKNHKLVPVQILLCNSMTADSKLTLIKTIHTIIWIFFNVVIFYLLYAVIADKIDKWVWIGLSLFLFEAIVLLSFKMKCPLTLIARRYSDSGKHNFDIYLPNWLAKHNLKIYFSILLIIILILAYRLAFPSL